jgi:hypothetical protein
MAIISRFKKRKPREKDDAYESRMDDPPQDVQDAIERENERFFGVHLRNDAHQNRPLSRDSAASRIEDDDSSVEPVGPPVIRAPNPPPAKKARRSKTGAGSGCIPAMPMVPILLPKPTKSLLKGPVSGNKGKSNAEMSLKDANERITALEGYVSEKLYPAYCQLHQQLTTIVTTAWEYMHRQGDDIITLSSELTDLRTKMTAADHAISLDKVVVSNLKDKIRDLKEAKKTHLSTISELKKEAKGKGSDAGDVLELERQRQAIKAEGTWQAAKAREDAKQYGISKKKERTDQRYQEKLNGAGMAQMMSGGNGTWQLSSVMGTQFASGSGQIGGGGGGSGGGGSGGGN